MNGEFGEKSQGIREGKSLEEVFRSYGGDLSALCYFMHFDLQGDIDRTVAELRCQPSRGGHGTVLQAIKWAVDQGGFPGMFRKYGIHPYDDYSTWQEFRKFIQSLE